MRKVQKEKPKTESECMKTHGYMELDFKLLFKIYQRKASNWERRKPQKIWKYANVKHTFKDAQHITSLEKFKISKDITINLLKWLRFSTQTTLSADRDVGHQKNLTY